MSPDARQRIGYGLSHAVGDDGRLIAMPSRADTGGHRPAARRTASGRRAIAT